jgi:hypothetical protein
MEKRALAQEIQRYLEEKEGELRGGDRRSAKARQANQKRPAGAFDTPSPGKRSTRVATRAGFGSEQEMRRVNTVAEQGTEELIEAMDNGEIPITVAERIAPALSEGTLDAL